MKKFIPFFILLFIFIYPVNIYAEAEKPDVEAIGAILMDYETGRVLWAKNSNKPLAMASTTKIMTAIVTLENGNLEDTVKVSRRASLAPEVNMNLREGEEIKLKDLLYALMLQSSNDAAIAIAEHIGGSVEDFCNIMTKRAAELGAQDTVFETPNGLDRGEHHSTAYDLAIIARHAMGMPKFVEIINTPSVTAYSSKNTYTITNKNRLLNEFEGANGVKTGFTGKAGHCFVGSAKRDEIQLISVVLASGWGSKGKEQKWRDTKEIMRYGFNNYSYENIITKGNKAGEISIERSKTPEVSFYYGDGFYALLSGEEKNNISVVCEYPEAMRAPVKKDQWVGTAKVYLGDHLLSEVNLLSLDNAVRHDLKTSLEKVLNTFFEMGTNNKINTVLPEF